MQITRSSPLMRFLSIPTAVFVWLCLALSLLACRESGGKHTEAHEAQHTVVLTSPVKKDVVTTQTYVSQIHSRRHIELRAPERGYLEEREVEEGQAVNQGQLLFKILPVVYKAKLHGDQAELQRADIALRNTKNLFAKNIVSDQELALAKAERAKAKAKCRYAGQIDVVRVFPTCVIFAKTRWGDHRITQKFPSVLGHGRGRFCHVKYSQIGVIRMLADVLWRFDQAASILLRAAPYDQDRSCWDRPRVHYRGLHGFP